MTHLRGLLAPLAVVLALSAVVARAQDHPLEAPGFVPNKAFDVHDYDSINMFNGNLVVSIPIGPTFHVGGNLSYGLTLHYNSKLWYWKLDTESVDPTQCEIDMQDPNYKCGTVTATASPRFNAAMGWTLSLGRLLMGAAEGASGANTYLYEDPDGATHSFRSVGGATTLYSDDGSYIRMIREHGDAGPVYVDSRDGVRRTFELQDVSLLYPHFAGQRLMLTRIADATGNHVDIGYTNGGRIWTITDIARTAADNHAVIVTFGSGGTELPSALSSVALPGPNGNRVTYSFTTVSTSMDLPDGVTVPGSITVPLLTRVQRPAGGDFIFTKNSVPAYITDGTAMTGCLTSMTIPTGAVYNWTFIEGSVPTRATKTTKPSVETPVEMLKREIIDPATNTTTTWNYHFGGVAAEGCIPANLYQYARSGAVQRPDQTVEVSYYSVFNKQPCHSNDQFNNTWDRNDYGLPFTKGMSFNAFNIVRNPQDAKRTDLLDPPDPNEPAKTKYQYLSSQTYAPNGTLLQSRYVTYEGDPIVGGSGATRPNARAVSEVTIDEGTSCQDGPCLSTTHRYSYREHGNYATSVTMANDLSAWQTRTTFRNFPAEVASFAWVLDDPTEECTVGGNQKTITQCLGTAGAFITLFDYDRQHNLLKAKRVVKDTLNGQLGAHDILTRYLYEDANDPVNNLGSNGNLTTEQSEGGDTGSLSVSPTDPFPAPVSPSLTIKHDHLYSDLSGGRTGALIGVRSHYSGFAFALSDFTLQRYTGLIESSRDSSGAQTNYTYDALGRLATVTPPGGAVTTYTFNDSSAPVSIDAITRKVAGSAVLKQAHYDYDGRGRLWHEKSLVGTAWSTRTTRYDNMSRVFRTSELRPETSASECGDTEQCTQTEYDPLGRTSKVTDLDGRTTTFSYVGSIQTTRVQQLDSTLSATWVETRDAFGRLHSVVDPKSTTGTYGYDIADHLTQAVVSDGTAFQTRSFAYDGRGFLTSETHPELMTNESAPASGTVFYTYDASGKVLTRNLTQSSPFDLQYVYDEAERIRYVNARQASGSSTFRVIKEFEYGDGNDYFNNKPDLVMGKLKSATRHNYTGTADIKVVEKYHYLDDAGHLTDRTTEIWNDGILKQSLSQSAEYNELGLIAKTNYPDCNTPADGSLPPCHSRPWPSVSRAYTEGRVTSVDGFATMTYAANEMLNTISHENLVVDTIEPDAKYRPRPNKITVVGQSAGSVCHPPVFVTEPLSQTIQSGGTASFSVVVTGDSPSYHWYQDGVVIASATSSTYTTPALTASHTYTVAVTNACGTISSTATVTVQQTCQAPVITSEPVDGIVALNQSVILTVGASGQNLSYTWFQAEEGTTTIGGTSANPTVRTLPLNRTMKFHVSVSNSCGSTWSRVATYTIAIPPTRNLVAVPASNGIALTWSLLSQYPVNHYSIERRAPNAAWYEVFQVSSTTTFWTDQGINMGYGMAYRVRAVEMPAYSDGVPNYGEFSNVDAAARYSFDDIPTKVSFHPLDQLREAINEIRLAAGLSPVTWSSIAPPDSQPQSGAVVAGAHVYALRVALDNALLVLSVPVTPYSDPGLPDATPVRLIHLTELQDRTK